MNNNPPKHPDIPGGLRPPVFVEPGVSPRLDAAAQRILESLDAGHRVVALRGLPGEGKTQVLRQIAAQRQGYYVELGDHPSAELALREGLSVIVESFGEQSCAHCSLRTVCARVRNTLYRHADNPLIIIDALDAPCSRSDLESLLDATRKGAVLVAGPGAQGVTEIKLDPANEQAFKQAYIDSLTAGNPLTAEELTLVEEIAPVLEFNPLRAEFVAELVRDQSDRVTSLREFLEAVQSEPTELDPQTASSISKVWRHLQPGNQTRVALVAILGEPGLPASWLPSELQVTAHTRAPLLTVSERQSERYVEAHRITSSFARQMGTQALSTILLDLMETWIANDQLLEELKARGARSRALVRGYLYLKKNSEDDSPRPSSLFMKAFVDAAPISNADALLRHLSHVADEPQSISQLPLDVVGEIFDHIPQRAARKNSELGRLRAAAFEQLDRLARSNSQVPHDDSDASDELASAMHHAAKALLRTENHDAQDIAIARFRELTERFRILLPRSPKYYIDLAQTQLQLVRSDYMPPDERVDLIRQMLGEGSEVLPAYLSLAVVTAALDMRPDTSLSNSEKISLVQNGLNLCKTCAILETQAHFLRAAVTVCDRVGASASLWNSVSQVASSLVAPAVVEALGERDAAALGHALVKGASQDYSRTGAELILGALDLYGSFIESPGPIVLSRLAAALRELGFAEEAQPIAAAVYWKEPLERRYYATFDFSKTLRASGRYREAISLVRKEREARRAQVDQSAALGDEYAKCAVRDVSLREEVRGILIENARYYRTANHLSYAQRCERWAANLELDPVSEGSLAEDEWRAQRRFLHLTDEERQRVVALAIRVAQRPEVAGFANHEILVPGSGSSEPKIATSGARAWIGGWSNRIRVLAARFFPRRSSKTLDVSRLERQLKRDYTGIFGLKVFWAATFTLLPLLINFKFGSVGLHVSAATIVYVVYHWCGIKVWMRVRRLESRDRSLFTPDERGAEILSLEPLRRFAALAGSITAILLLFTLLAKLSIESGDQDVTPKTWFPRVLSLALGVDSEQRADAGR